MLGRASRKTEAAEVVRLVRIELSAMHRVHGVSDMDIARLSTVVRARSTSDAWPWLVASALVQWPRPPWVVAEVGSYPAHLELANPLDVASEAEFGPLGEGT